MGKVKGRGKGRQPEATVASEPAKGATRNSMPKDAKVSASIIVRNTV